MPEKPTYEELEKKVNELEESERKYRHLFDTAMVGIYRTRIEDGKFLAANQTIAELMGYDSVDQFVAEYVTSKHYTDPKRRDELLRQIQSTGRVDGFEIEMIRTDGSHVQIAISATAYPERGYLEGVVIDITEHKKAEEALRESEEKYRNIYETSPDVIFATDLEGTILETNPRSKDVVDYTPEELIGKNVSIFYKNIKDRIPFVNALEAHGFVKDYELTFVTKNGEDVHVSFNANLIFGENGKPIKIEGTIRDVTDRKRSEKELRESEEKYRTVLESIEDGYFEVDIAGNFTFFNDSMSRLLRYPRDELMGMNNREYMDKENARKIYQTFNKVYNTGNPTKALDWELVRKDGSTCYVETVVSLIKDSDGQPSGFRGIARDVTERKLAEGELQKLALVLKYSSELVNLATLDGKMIFLNESGSKMLGINPDEVARIHLMEVIPDQITELVQEELLPALMQGNTWEGELKYRNLKTGEITDVHAMTFTVKDPNTKKPLFLANVSRDITEQKRAEEEKTKLEIQLQQAQKLEAMGTLAGGIAHDFNNLLMGIQGRTSLMLMDSDASHSHFEHLKGIEDYVKSAADLTRQLLGFARGGKYEIKPADLNELIINENRMFGRTRKEINIQEKFEQNLWTVEIDRRQIEQVLLNIYVNAWQAMPGGGNLYVQTENTIIDESYIKPYQVESGNYVKISITDTGVGMDEVTRQKIFDPFFTTKELGRGTGLGLASAYGIIKNHHGFINVYSKKDEGTTFNIFLPASEKEAVKEQKIDDKLVTGTGIVILVDDEDMIIEIGQKIIENLGYEVLVAQSGKEAVAVYEKNRDRIDMVILDMIMPEMNGGETYDKLKEINPDIKVLLSSGYSIDGQATEILERGCNGFIQKPFNMADLSKKIREILDKD